MGQQKRTGGAGTGSVRLAIMFKECDGMNGSDGMTRRGCKDEERIIINADSSGAQEAIIPSKLAGKTKTRVRNRLKT